MSALDSLIRLHRWQLDEHRRDLATLEDLAAKLGEERRKLEAEDAHEREVAASSPEAGFAYAAYVRRLIERRHKIEQSQAEVAHRIAQAREALAEAFRDVKRYEVAAANRARQQEQQEARRENKIMDDLGIEGFRRKAAENS